jgi:hypothetical protein
MPDFNNEDLLIQSLINLIRKLSRDSELGLSWQHLQFIVSNDICYAQ